VALAHADAVDAKLPIEVADEVGEPRLEGVAHELAADVGVVCAVVVAGAVAAVDGDAEGVEDAVAQALKDASGDRDALGDGDELVPTLCEGRPVAVFGGDDDALVLCVEPAEAVDEAEVRGLLVADCGAEGERDWRGDADALVERRAVVLSDAQPVELRDARALAESLRAGVPEGVAAALTLARAERLAQPVAPMEGDAADVALLRAEADASTLALAPAAGDGVPVADPHCEADAAAVLLAAGDIEAAANDADCAPV